MPLSIQDLSYAGEAAANVIVRAMTGADTIQGGHLYVRDGIRKSYTIPRLTSTGILQPRQATPTSSTGDFIIDGTVLTPEDYMIYTEFNPRDFEQHWFAAQLNPGLIDRALPATVEGVILSEVLRLHNRALETMIWQGDKTSSNTQLNYIDGYVKKLAGNASTVKVANAVALTDGNIMAKLEEVYRAIPDALIYDPSMRIYVSYKTAQIFRNAQVAQTYKGVDPTLAGVMQYAGIPVVRLAGMPNDCIVATRGSASADSNLWLGMDSTSDQNMVQMAKVQNNSELYFIKVLMKVDVQVGFYQEAILYNVG